jgi:hypothetical protein
LAPAYPEDLERASAQGTILIIEVDGVVYGKGRVREHGKHHPMVHLVIFAFTALAIASAVVLMKRSDWSDILNAFLSIFKRKKQLKAELYELEDDIPIFDLVEQRQIVKTKASMDCEQSVKTLFSADGEQSIPPKRMKQLKQLLKKMNKLIHSRSNVDEKSVDELASQVYETMEDEVVNDEVVNDKVVNEAIDHEASSTGSSSDRFVDEPIDQSDGETEISYAMFVGEPKDENSNKSK